jgi:general secretion pathway protein G
MSSNRRNRGFSLVEIMIVIVIMGLLAGVVAVNVRSYLIKAKQSAVRHDLALITDGLDQFWAEFNRYPTQEEGLEILAKPSDKIPDPLLKDVPIDPWGRPYVYVPPTSANGSPDVVCLGADNKERGTGADADIAASTLRKPKAESP